MSKETGEPIEAGDKKIIVSFSIYSIIKILGLLVLIGLFYFLRDVLILIFIAFVIATFLEPIVHLFDKKKVPRYVTVILLYVIIIGGLILLFRAIIPPLVSQANQLAENKDFYINIIKGYLDKLPLVGPSEVNQFISGFASRLSSFSATGIFAGALGVFSGFSGAVMVLILTFYFLLEKHGIERGIASYFPTHHSKKAVHTFTKISEKVSLWARGQIVLSFSLGVVTFIALSILGVDFALTLAVLAAILDFVPILGPIIAGVITFIVALSDSLGKAIGVVVLFFILQQLESGVLAPNIFKKAVGLTPAVIIIAILLGGKLFGILGIVLAVPLASSLSVLLDDYYLNKNKGGE